MAIERLGENYAGPSRDHLALIKKFLKISYEKKQHTFISIFKCQIFNLKNAYEESVLHT